MMRKATAWVGAFATVLLAACSSIDLPTTPQTLITPSVDNSLPPGSGYVRVCKVSGPADTYTFNVVVSGGGNHTLPRGPVVTLTFDGTNPVCDVAYESLNDVSWTAGMTSQVTVSENMPPGISVPEIQVVDPDYTVPTAGKPFGYRYSVFNTNTITLTHSVTDKRKLYYYNIDIPLPPVVATCYGIVAIQGVPISPVQLTASGGMGGPYTFEAITLPAGLTLSTSGLLSGTPTVSGNFTYTIIATDVDGNTGRSSCAVSIDVPPPPPGGSQGCTPGYWKVKQHWDSWAPTGYTTTQLISSVFNVPATFVSKRGAPISSSSLVDGLGFQGGSTLSGKAEILLRAAIAGLLNSSNGNVDYFTTTANLITAVNAALNSGDGAAMVALAAQIDAENNKGCPLN